MSAPDDRLRFGAPRLGEPRFEAVVLPQLDAAYALARWLLQDPALAQDVVQDAMVRALSYFGTYRGGNPRAWVLQIVRNAAYAARAKGRALCEEMLDEGTPDGAADPEYRYAQREALGQMTAAIGRLPVALRECLVLRELEGMSYRDIAEVTGAPVGTVMSRLWRARQALLDGRVNEDVG